jgi:transcriptional regulator with XRE-family HTH domain
MTCAEWIKNRREKLKLTQGELAEQSGVSEQMIDDIESGECPVHLGTKRKLEKVLGSYPPPPVDRMYRC